MPPERNVRDVDRDLYHRRFGPAARGASAAQLDERLYGNQHRDDIIQEALIGVWKASLTHGDNLTPGLVYTAARRAATTAVKSAAILDMRKRVTAAVVPIAEVADTRREPSHSDGTNLAGLRADLTRELGQLPAWERVFLHAWIVDGCSQREAAERAGVTYPAAQTKWTRDTRPRLTRRLATYRGA